MKAEEIRAFMDSEPKSAGMNYPRDYWVAEIAAQLAELNQNLRDIHPELNLPEKCRQHKCEYYTEYLAHGPAELPHEGYHAAVTNGTNHMQNCTRMERSGSCPSCAEYERLLRA